tara:strand:- start:11331 stop:11657 length:327 start_codon:yes stop_codon:yes gene_type:complete
MGSLSAKDCIPCEGGVPPLSEEESNAFLAQINEDWRIVDNHHLTRSWEFPDFSSAMIFTNSLGDICEDQGHHADFELGWGRVVALIYTHKIDGLTESDFVLASKFDDV